MANIFISYNREDEDKTRALVNDIEGLGHTVWFDHELSGGQKWWDTILESIRNCDILLFVLSNESLNSSACNLEYDYAFKLGKTILPVLVGEKVSIKLLPPILSQIQFVDYRKTDRDALLHLAKALTSTPPSQPLPEPLPEPPEVPISYLGKLGKQIANTSKLSYEEQSTLFIDLKRGLHDPETEIDTRTLLKKLRKRQYLFENIAREIDELLEDPVSKTKHSIKKLSESEENEGQEEADEVRKKSFWTSLPSIIAALVIVMGLYFVSKYIVPTNQAAYVCYDKKIMGDNGEIVYKGCVVHETDCRANRKEHFGRYPNTIDTESAYSRCVKGTPRTVPQIVSVSELVKRAKAYYHGTSSMQVDYVRAREYFLKAAKLNSMDAYRYMGTIYLFGKGVATNKSEAKRWLQMAIKLGDKRAKEIYGTYIGHSEELEKTKKELIELKRQQEKAKAERLKKEKEEIERLRKEKVQSQREELKRLREEAERKRLANIAKEKVISFNENGIYIHLIYPSSVRSGQSFKLIVEMTNNSQNAKQGGLTLSFPNMNYLGGRILHYNFTSVKSYSNPTPIYNAQAKKNIPAKYFMVEGWQNKLWSYKRTKSFSIELTAPTGLDELKVNLRGILWIRNKNDTRKIPAFSGYYDQQGYAVKPFSIKIKR